MRQRPKKQGRSTNLPFTTQHSTQLVNRDGGKSRHRNIDAKAVDAAVPAGQRLALEKQRRLRLQRWHWAWDADAFRQWGGGATLSNFLTGRWGQGGSLLQSSCADNHSDCNGGGRWCRQRHYDGVDSRHINIKKHIMCLIRLCFCHVTKATQRHAKPWNIVIILTDMMDDYVGEHALTGKGMNPGEWQGAQNIRCAWAGGTYCKLPLFLWESSVHQFHVIYCVTLAYVLYFEEFLIHYLHRFMIFKAWLTKSNGPMPFPTEYLMQACTDWRTDSN